MKKLILVVSVVLSVAAPTTPGWETVEGCYGGRMQHVSDPDYDYDATLCFSSGLPVFSTSEYVYDFATCVNALSQPVPLRDSWKQWSEIDADPDLCGSGLVWVKARPDGCVDHQWRWQDGTLDATGTLCP